jgi:hypothetical protein
MSHAIEYLGAEAPELLGHVTAPETVQGRLGFLGIAHKAHLINTERDAPSLGIDGDGLVPELPD